MINYQSKKPKSLFRTIAEHLAVLLFWFLIWGIASYAVGEELLLPSPSSVIRRLAELIITADFWLITATSLIRILLGIAIAILIGVVLAFLTANIPFLYTLFRPFITVVRSTPIASFVILAIIWIGRDLLPIFISSLIVLPVVWGNMQEGLTAIDRELREVTDVYKFSITKKIRRLYLPYIAPYFTSAVKTSIGLAWKAGIAAEVLTLPIVSIGKQLSNAKTYIETVDLFAWTLTVILMSLVLELIFVKLIPSKKEKRRSRKKEVSVYESSSTDI